MNYTNVSIKSISDDRIAVKTPFNREAISKFKMVGGRWDSDQNAWIFDVRDEGRARQALIEVFGTDGEESTELVTIHVEYLSECYEKTDPVIIAGREVARASGRDSGARLGLGVSVVGGPVPRSGGSVKNWRTVMPAGTIIEIKDLPRAAVEAIPDTYYDSNSITVTIVEEQKADNRAKLEALRAKLLAELADVDQQLEKLA